MTTKILGNRDYAQNEIQNARLQNLASAPSGPVPGQVYYDTTLSCVMIWNGAAWRPVDASKLTDGTIQISALASNPFNRANSSYFGQTTVSSLSDYTTATLAFRLNQFAAPNADVNWNSVKITNLAPGVAGTDAVNLAQAQGFAQSAAAGISSKPPVTLVATTNQALTGNPTVDSVAVTAGMVVLCAAQTTTSQNGPYVVPVGGGLWTRRTSSEGATAELDLGATWLIEQGTTYAGTQFRLSQPTTGTITVGSTGITIVQFNAAQSINPGNGLNQTGNTFNVVPGNGIIADGTSTRVDPAIVMRKYTQLLTTSASSYLISHGLGTQRIMANARDVTSQVILEIDCTATSTTTATIGITPAPTANSVEVLIIG